MRVHTRVFLVIAVICLFKRTIMSQAVASPVMAQTISNEIIHLILNWVDDSSLLDWQLVCRGWSDSASTQLYSRGVHIRSSRALLGYLESSRNASEVYGKVDCLHRTRQMTIHARPEAEHLDQLREILSALSGEKHPEVNRVTLACPELYRVVNQEKTMQSTMIIGNLLAILQPKRLEILGGTLPYAPLSWQPQEIIMSEAKSYEHLLPIFLLRGADTGTVAHSSLTTITIIMQGKFQPREEKMQLPHRIRGRFFRLLQLLERAADFAKLTIVGLGAIAPPRLRHDPEIPFVGPVAPWSTTLPGSSEIDFATEAENEEALAVCLRDVVLSNGWLRSDEEWTSKVFFRTHALPL